MAKRNLLLVALWLLNLDPLHAATGFSGAALASQALRGLSQSTTRLTADGDGGDKLAQEIDNSRNKEIRKAVEADGRGDKKASARHWKKAEELKRTYDSHMSELKK